jgi:hypothetical protein
LGAKTHHAEVRAGTANGINPVLRESALFTIRTDEKWTASAGSVGTLGLSRLKCAVSYTLHHGEKMLMLRTQRILVSALMVLSSSVMAIAQTPPAKQAPAPRLVYPRRRP